MSIGALNISSYKQIVASGNVKVGQGGLLGMWVSAASGTPTITIYDDAGTGTTVKIIDTFTPVASSWYPMPFAFSNGLNIVLSGTVSATLGYV